jgi:hypothetical protein
MGSKAGMIQPIDIRAETNSPRSSLLAGIGNTGGDAYDTLGLATSVTLRLANRIIGVPPVFPE